MAGTSGLSSRATNGAAPAILTAINGGAAFSLTGPQKVLFYSTSRTNNDNSGTAQVEWTTSGGYTAGTGFSGLTWAASAAATTGATAASSIAATITNAPAQTWAGCTVVDSTATPKETWYAPVSPTKTVNAGDTVTVPSGQFTVSIG